MNYDFCGYVTKNNVRCTDGVTILQNAFAHQDGAKVPLVWMHDHANPENTLGNVYLENRDDGVYGYGSFNDSEKALAAKSAVMHGDVDSMSIFAGRVKKNGNFVCHGEIKEVSLVLAGANPEAKIENIIRHSDEDDEVECDMYLNMGDGIGFVKHSDDDDDILEHGEKTVKDVLETFNEEQKKVLYYLIGEAVKNAKSGVQHSDDDDDILEHGDKTVEDVVNTMNPEQKKAMMFLIGVAVENAKNNGGKNDMAVQHNVFEGEDTIYEAAPISHADQEMILKNARETGNRTFKGALTDYLADRNENGELDDVIQHGFEDISELYPDPHKMYSGAPEAIPEDLAWVSAVNNGTTKSPFPVVKTRRADISKVKASGYQKKGDYKKNTGDITLAGRKTHPQTVYIKDTIDRDDIIDIVDFDVVNYMQGVMRQALYRLLATAILIGDGLPEDDESKIHEENIHSIWHDDELYTIHQTVDFKGMEAKLQGTETSQHFGEEYIRTEAIIESSLYAREKYKGRGALAFYCEPHTISVMLMARDFNGRRIYNSTADIKAALNVTAIHTVEDMANQTRQVTGADRQVKTHKLLGIFVNMADYQVGSAKGGQITSFNDFDIDFNQQKFMMETRLSGALVGIKSAIALEEDVTV